MKSNGLEPRRHVLRWGLGLLFLASLAFGLAACQGLPSTSRLQYLIPLETANDQPLEPATAGAPSGMAAPTVQRGNEQVNGEGAKGMPKDLPMQSVLWDAEQLAISKGLSKAELKQALAAEGLKLDDSGRVLVEIVAPEGGKALPVEQVTPFGGEVTNAWERRTETWVPVDQLTNLARSLPPGYFIERVGPLDYDDVDGEGPGATNSDEYRDGGANCSGITIGVIDGGFDNLTEARNNGDAPSLANTTLINYTPNSFEDPADKTHGTGVVEALFDHCPGATWRIYKIDSLSDMGTAVTNGLNNGVDVFSHSLSRYNTGWADDSGSACTAANNAANNGALFFTSAGNRARQHWQGNFNAGPDGDVWHDWVNGDEALSITLPNNAGGNFYLSWNTAGDTYDLDLYLLDSTLDPSDPLKKSTNGGNNYEDFYYKNTTGAAQTVYVAVQRDSGGVTEFELFAHLSSASYDFERQVAAGSTTSPSNCTRSNVISVAAVDWSDFPDPPGTNGIIQSYSSRGPSNSGVTLPDISGPTNTTGFTYAGGFGGTSSATPNAAGTAAAFWSSASSLSASGVRYLIFEQAKIFKDWGAAGADNTYGRGGIQLYSYRANTVWVDRRAGNVLGSATLPYYYVSHAQNAAVSGGRIVFLGQNYPETITLNKRLLYETIGWSAILGD